MGQSNSEHSRHWFFGGKMVIDGEEKSETLFQMVKATLPKGVPNNSIIAKFNLAVNHKGVWNGILIEFREARRPYINS